LLTANCSQGAANSYPDSVQSAPKDRATVSEKCKPLERLILAARPFCRFRKPSFDKNPLGFLTGRGRAGYHIVPFIGIGKLEQRIH
jgi:hypothetical protein